MTHLASSGLSLSVEEISSRLVRLTRRNFNARPVETVSLFTDLFEFSIDERMSERFRELLKLLIDKRLGEPDPSIYQKLSYLREDLLRETLHIRRGNLAPLHDCMILHAEVTRKVEGLLHGMKDGKDIDVSWFLEHIVEPTLVLELSVRRGRLTPRMQRSLNYYAAIDKVSPGRLETIARCLQDLGTYNPGLNLWKLSMELVSIPDISKAFKKTDTLSSSDAFGQSSGKEVSDPADWSSTEKYVTNKLQKIANYLCEVDQSSWESDGLQTLKRTLETVGSLTSKECDSLRLDYTFHRSLVPLANRESSELTERDMEEAYSSVTLTHSHLLRDFTGSREHAMSESTIRHVVLKLKSFLDFHKSEKEAPFREFATEYLQPFLVAVFSVGRKIPVRIASQLYFTKRVSFVDAKCIEHTKEALEEFMKNHYYLFE